MKNPSIIRYTMYAIIFAMANIALIACGDDSKSISPESPARDVSTIYDLGACTKDRYGDTLFVKDKSIDYLCVGGNWIDITTQNVDTTKSDSSNVEPKEVETIYELGACNEKREGVRVLVVESGMGYVCRSEQWLQMVIQSSSSVSGKNESSSSKKILSSSSSSKLSSSNVSVDDPVCHDCKSSSSAKLSYIEVKTKDQLGTCNSKNLDMRALVLADSSYYTCKAKGWAKDTVYLGYEIVKTREDLPGCNAGNAKQRILVKKDSVFFACDAEKWNPETDDGFVVKKASILGAAQKGPFKFNSLLQLREVLLRNDSLVYTGRRYDDEISSNKGDFVIPKVNLVYPYAVLEVRGQWRNEVSGEYSKDSMTLRVLTDLSKRTEVNINLLTHLEYDRAAKLVNKGYSVYAAKKQADYEIMTALGFATSVEYSEDLKTFVPSTSENYAENATLMAISLLFIGDRNDAEIQKAISSFKSDLAEDGEWNNGQMKADMADWAESFDGGSVRANVKSWNILDIPNYESYLTVFWNNAYELGGCASTRIDVVATNKNTYSKNNGVHYICKEDGWHKATDIEKDTYQWKDGKEGEVKKGGVTGSYYVYENGKWTVAKNENTLGLCTTKRKGEVGKIDSTYFICDDNSWRKATVLEYDTYGFGIGNEGDVRTGKVNRDKYYVYENGAWRASTSEIENNLGACITSRLNEVSMSGSKYYTCKTSGWVLSTTLEYDTYGWKAGIEGEVKEGSVTASNHYVYVDGAWRATVDDMEYEFGVCVTKKEGEKHIQKSKYYICENKSWKQITAEEYGLGYCTPSNEGVVEGLKDAYYICKSECWTTATVLEYDTYGKTCSEDGTIVSGNVITKNKYVCDADMFRTANEMEISLNKGCVSYTENDEIRKQVSEGQDSVYTCKGNIWVGSVEFYIVHGTLLDTRDEQTYKTVTIGTQKWMAENLNYADSINYPSMKGQNWCSLHNCAKYGRLYSWAVAMDSDGIFSTNGNNCGYGKICSPTYPVRGICPAGWHLPTSTEWKTLYSAMGSSSYAMQAKYFEKWTKATDAYGFSARPDGSHCGSSFCDVGYVAGFWSATEYDSDYTYIWGIDAYSAGLYSFRKYYGYSVRCLQD